MNIVFDACAVVALFSGEVGHEVVDTAVVDHSCFIHALNLAEVYRIVARDQGAAAAESVVTDLQDQGVQVCEDMDGPFWREYVRICLVARCALADSFAMALARRLGAAVLTSEHNEFQEHVTAGTCPVHFFRTPGPKVAAIAVPLPVAPAGP